MPAEVWPKKGAVCPLRAFGAAPEDIFQQMKREGIFDVCA